VSDGLRLMSVHAHADDETITMGGTLATLHDRGVRTCNVCCTDGKVATIVAEDMPEETTRPRLAAIRQEELRTACAILGVDEVVFLEYGDSGMWGADTNEAPDAFWKADIHEAVGRLVAEIRRFRPHVVATYNAIGGYGHPDHIQAHRVAVLAVEAASQQMLYPDAGDPWRVSKLYYTAMAESFFRKASELAKAAGQAPPFGVDDPAELPFILPDAWVTTSIDVTEGLDRKREALIAHHSQIGPDWPLLTIPAAVMREHFNHETYELAVSHVPTTWPETDLFAGISPGDGLVRVKKAPQAATA
jgi:N-acetyl-1-D-myo-inositol-2-amino-2-deoxy-alpha-D-glucopyranoside deacetylase